MKKILIMRHAEAVSHHLADRDINRQLTEKGKSQAQDVGKQLKVYGFAPDLVMASTAVRVQETLVGLRQTLEIDDQKIKNLLNFYLAGYETVMEELAAVPDEVSNLMILGHNPGWSDLVQQLTRRLFDLMPAQAALLQIDFEGSWVAALAEIGGWQRLENFQSNASVII